MEIVRKSYRTQLANAIQKIAGEYKVSFCFALRTVSCAELDLSSALITQKKFRDRLGFES